MAKKGLKAIDVKQGINKKFAGGAYSGDDLLKMTTPRLRSGCFLFDLHTHGGIPRGKISMFHGVKSGGKSTFAMRLVGQHQRAFPNQSVVFADFEHTFDWPWADNFIPDRGRCHVIQPRYGELGIDWILEYMRADDVGMVVVDSIATMIPMKEAESSAMDQFVGGNPKLVNALLRRVIPAQVDYSAGGRDVTVLLINQIRAKFGAQSFGAQISQPGGHMLEHLVSLDVRFYFKENKIRSKTPIAATHIFRTEKNKLGVPKMTGEYTQFLLPVDGRKVGDLAEVDDVLEFARKAGLIKQKGREWVIGRKKFPTIAAMKLGIAENPDLKESLKEQTLEACLLNPTATLLSEEDADE